MSRFGIGSLRSAVSAVLLGAGAISMTACTTVGSEPDAAIVNSRNDGDRFRGANEAVFAFNRSLDRNLVAPIGDAYSRMLESNRPGRLVRRRVGNFLEYLHGPIDFVNNMLQGKFRRGFSGVGRLLVNSTVGFAGFFDPATRWGMPRYAEDFGQALAVWGVPPGPYLVLPFLGPGSIRDAIGIAFDWQFSPIIQHEDTSTRNGLIILHQVDGRTRWPPGYELALQAALDPYVQTRSYYEMFRDREIVDGELRDPYEALELPEFETFEQQLESDAVE